jgi:hypothetical protein
MESRAPRGCTGTTPSPRGFRIGSSLIAVASTARHYMNVYRDGKRVRALADHRENPRHPERDVFDDREGEPGRHGRPRLQHRGALVGADHLERRLPARRLLVGGRPGLHQRQPWLREHVARQRRDLLRDGRPRRPGKDPRQPRAGQWDNGWTMWFRPWHKYVRGSALHKAVRTGPHGSMLVSPRATARRHRHRAPPPASTSHLRRVS